MPPTYFPGLGLGGGSFGGAIFLNSASVSSLRCFAAGQVFGSVSFAAVRLA